MKGEDLDVSKKELALNLTSLGLPATLRLLLTWMHTLKVTYSILMQEILAFT